MEIVTSKQNSKIVETKKLFQKKYREERGLFVAETRKVIEEALACGLEPVYIFVQQDVKNLFSNYAEKVIYVSQNVIKEISSTISPDGYVAVFEKPVCKKSLNDLIKQPFLVLDCLQNPDNMGAIMRSALASNFKTLLLIDCVDEFNPKTIRASMGNQFKLDILHISYQDVKEISKSAKLFVADMNGKNIFDIESFEQSVGFVVGNEGNGVSKTLKDCIENTISIPMQNGVESLNASVSASIIMFYIANHLTNA